jgi:2,5-dioxopentanoate dehydrogenase
MDQKAMTAELDELLAAAAGYQAPAATERAAFLRKIGEEIDALGEELLTVCAEETGLGRDRLAGERARTVNQLRMFANLIEEGSWVDARIDTAQPDRKPVPKPDVRRIFEPLGPVGVFAASNFPLAFSVAGGDTASALAAGCPVVV